MPTVNTVMVESESTGRGSVAHRAASTADWIARHGHFILITLAAALVIGSLQAALFYRAFTPRVEQANRLLFDLIIERSQRELHRRVEKGVEELADANAEPDRLMQLQTARQAFDETFSTAPVDALQSLRTGLKAFDATESTEAITGLLDDINRLEEIHIDRYKPLLEELENPPLYLWPVAHVLAEDLEYRKAIAINRALYLAQVGEVGTARVILTGLRASTESQRTLGIIYYLLGRLEFELFLSRPETELHAQSVEYVRQSLKADPHSPLAKRFLDYLLSLRRSEPTQRGGKGDPTDLAEGEGAAVADEERRF